MKLCGARPTQWNVRSAVGRPEWSSSTECPISSLVTRLEKDKLRWAAALSTTISRSTDVAAAVTNGTILTGLDPASGADSCGAAH